ncbi:MAG: hypothetical protein RL385_1359 [Pseudomonadota bacterium]|jgi:CBS domain-containing protein
MRVADIMTRELLTISSAESVSLALARAQERDVHHLLVVELGRLKGVTCICDLRDRPPKAELREVLRRAPEVIWPQSTLKQAARRFIDKGVSCFPVCDGAELVGVITRGDLRRSVIAEDELPVSFRCSFCGSTRHVRAVMGQPGLAACLDCSDRTAPMATGLFDEGAKG